MNIFDVINEIETNKTAWIDLSDDFKKAYSQFMLNRFISSKKVYLPLIAKLSTLKLSDEQHYNFLCSIINKQKHYFDYKAYKTTKTLDPETLFALTNEFKLGKKDVERFLEVLTEKDVKMIVDKWHAMFVDYK